MHGLPPGADREALKQAIEALPDLMEEDLMKAWEKVAHLKSLLADTLCAAEFDAFTEAVRDCDAALTRKKGQALLSCLAVDRKSE